MSNEQVSESNIEFWNKLWKIPTTADEIFTLIQPEDVRMLRKNQPTNLATMYEQAVSQLTRIVDQPVSKYYPNALTCIRVLTRLTPFMLEDPQDKWVRDLFWSGEHPLGQRTIEAIIGLLFVPEFTVARQAYDAYLEQKDVPGVFPSMLYASGVAFPDTSISSNSSYDRNRKEVLKLLLLCFSGVMYHPSESLQNFDDPFLHAATNACNRLAPTLFYSLLNVVIMYDPIGWGVPYASSVWTNEREGLVDVSIQVFLVLLDYGKKEQGNVYRRLTSSIRRNEDFQLMYAGFNRILNNSYQALNTYLPYSIKQIKCHQETLVLLWKCLDTNDGFREYWVQQKDACRILVPIIFLMCQGRQDSSQVGLIHICTFILLVLSGERDFCVSLNLPFDLRLPLDLPPFTGTHGDFLLIGLHKMIVNGHETLNSVYNCFLTVICNISPYCKSLCMASSVRLIRLFKIFSTQRYLFDKEANHQLMFFLLDTLNNILQYQYAGNQHLVYAILQHQEIFQQLEVLSMPSMHTQPDNQEVSATRFVPTQEWFETWQSKLQLTPILRLIQHMSPRIDQIVAESGNGSIDEANMMKFLKTTTMVGLLPVPHPIVIRKYQPNDFTNLWFTTFTWGVIFLRNQGTLYICDA